MRHRSFILHQKTKDIIHRCDASILGKELQGKTELVVIIRLGQVQRELYIRFLKAIHENNQMKKCAFNYCILS